MLNLPSFDSERGLFMASKIETIKENILTWGAIGLIAALVIVALIYGTGYVIAFLAWPGLIPIAILIGGFSIGSAVDNLAEATRAQTEMLCYSIEKASGINK